jgi:hypothetical protein
MKCAVHPDREAIGGCCSCGRYVCPECKVDIDGQIYCNQCLELKLRGGAWPGAASAGTSNTSGLGALSKAPPEISGWNWGAFFLTWIWGIGNNVWIAFVALCGLLPYVGWIISLVMAIILGVRGNEWAWQNKRWDSIEHFQKTQRTWMWWGLGMLLLQIALIAAVTVLIISLVMIAATTGLDRNFNWRSIFPSM